MKIHLTETELRELISEKIGRFKPAKGTYDYILNKPKCEQYLDKTALPDSILAIFFGDQLVGAGVEETPMSADPGFLQSAIEHDTLLGKLQTPDAVARANKIDPATADTIRSALGMAIDFAFPIEGHIFCKQVADTVKWFKKTASAFGITFDDPAVGAAAVAGDAAMSQAGVDMSQELTSCYQKVSQSEYMLKLNQGRITGVDAMDFFFFPFSMSALSTGNAAQLTEEVVKKDLEGLEKKIKDVKNLTPLNSIFQDFFNVVFHNPITGTSKDAEMLCRIEIDEANKKIMQPGAVRLLKELTEALKNDYMQKTRIKVERYQQILGRVPNGAALLQLINNYSLI